MLGFEREIPCFYISKLISYHEYEIRLKINLTLNPVKYFD